ncbi:hypothetical protein WJX84_012231 [Apatococcus fuscideae]|uniref:RING-type domain-containing protein n=1 Tax=Apatococcus fuscideae TaxID=2026836 RepID=A0AAW1RZK1_9CHLO
MRDPVTAPECMHSFCAACIDEYIFDLQARTCPVCQLEGVETNLGNLPYHHHRLQFDFTLADIIRKLFPRPEVEQQIEERRQDERRFMEQAQRKGQQSEASTPTGSPGQSLPGFAPPSADMISLLLLPIAAHQRASNVALPDHPSNTPTQPGISYKYMLGKLRLSENCQKMLT